MTWLRAIPFLFTLLAFVLQPASASAFGPAHPEARVNAFELVAMASVGASAETSPGLHEGIGEAYDENASGYRFAARGTAAAADDVAAAAGRGVRPPSTPFGRSVESLRSGEGPWRLSTAHAEGATGRAYRGATSIEEVFHNTQTGERIVRHRIVRGDEILHETFRPYAKFGAD